MHRILVLAYGVTGYVAFAVAILYGIGFVGNFLVPKTIDSGEVSSVGVAVFVNVLLLALFAIQHTIMARPQFKRWWTKVVPKPIERSTFVLAASLILLLLYWQWRPIPTTVWEFESTVLRAVLTIVSLSGWVLVFYSSFVIDHFDLFGLRQPWLHFRNREYSHPKFVERTLYRYIRHPLMAGFLVAFWSAPTMSQGRLLFAVVTTAYILFGTAMEERDLLKILGEDYRQYRARTPMLFPFPQKRAEEPLTSVSTEE